MALADRDTQVLQRSGAAFTKKAPLNSFWQSVAENHYPERADFTTGAQEDMTSGLYSSEPVLFRREFGNFIGSVLRPKGKKWFNVVPQNTQLRDLIKVKTYLEPKSDMMRGLLYAKRANYTRAMHVADHDYATFGNAVGSVTETKDLKGVSLRTWHLRDCAWLQNDEAQVDTLFRKFEPTVRDLVAKEKAGWELSPKLDALKSKELDRKIPCLHVEMPIINYDYSIKRPKFEWVSLYYDLDNNHLMSFKNIPEFDYFVDRWFLIDGSQYALSPCTVCSMPDARSLQVMTWSIIEAGEKAVEPPLVATHEAILGGVNFSAASITWIDKNYDERTGEAIRALELGGNPQFGEVLRQSITQNLNAAWFLNKLLMPQTYDKTAYEANRLHEEFLRAMHPIIEPAEAERNGNHLDVVFNKTVRLGLWGDPKEMPEELRGEDIEYTYDNPMEEAIKQESSFAYKSAMEINQIAKEFDPKVIAQFNHQKAYRDAIAGVAPPDWLLSEDEAQEAVDQANEAETMDGAAQQMAMMSEAAAKATPRASPEKVAA